MGVNVKVGGKWLAEIGPASPPTWTTSADGGCGEASWNMTLPATFRHPALRRGKLVQIKFGAANLWTGVLSEPEHADDGWGFHATGLADQASGYLALTSTGDTTSTPDTAVDQAIVRGLPWTRPTSLSSAPLKDTGDGTDALNYLNELLDVWADTVSKRWGVNADGELYATADPTAPTWHLVPESATFGLADDEYASDIYLRYYGTDFTLATATASDATAAALYGRREFIVDGTSYGPIAAAKATANAQGLLDKGKARLGWTNSLEPTRYQLTTTGGAPASLALVKAQQMVRLHGLTNEQGQPVAYVDFVIGSTSYDAGENTLSIAPVGLVARSLSDVLAVS
jgi:hypothetical protein